MTRDEIINRLLAQKSCLQCQISGKRCNENCPTQYDAGTIDETIETLGETIKIIENQKSVEDELKKIKEEFDDVKKSQHIWLIDQNDVIDECLLIIDEHISELKGEKE